MIAYISNSDRILYHSSLLTVKNAISKREKCHLTIQNDICLHITDYTVENVIFDSASCMVAWSEQTTAKNRNHLRGNNENTLFDCWLHSFLTPISKDFFKYAFIIFLWESVPIWNKTYITLWTNKFDVGIKPYFMLFIPKSLHNIYQAQDFLSTKPHKVQSALTLKCKQLPDFKRFFFKTTLYDFSANYGFENPVRTAL